MAAEVSRARSASWVLKYGPPQLDSLLGTIVSHKVPATESDSPAEVAKAAACDQNLAQFLLDVEGHIVTWSSGAVRIYQHTEDQAIGQHVSALDSVDENNGSEPQRELTRSAAEGHFGNESWHLRKDGMRSDRFRRAGIATRSTIRIRRRGARATRVKAASCTILTNSMRAFLE